MSAPAGSGAGGGRRWAPRIGWPASVLVGLAVWAACAGIVDADWVEGDVLLLYAGLAGLLVSAVLVASPLSGRWAASIAGLTGLLFVAQLVARAFPPLQDVRQWLGALISWLWQRTAGGATPPLDLSLWAESADRWAAFAERLAAWASSLLGGASVVNPAAFLFVSGTMLWASAVWAVWWTARRGRPLLAMLPLGLALSASTYLASAPLGWVLAFAACLAILLPIVHLRLEEARWEREGVDYSPEIGFDVWQVAILIAIGGALLSLLTPNLQLTRVVSSFWGWVEPARVSITDGMTRLFGGVEPRDPPSLLLPGAGPGVVPATGGGLPRAHLVSGNPRLLRQRVMTVCIDAPPPAVEESPVKEGLVGPQYYWRGITYDTFDGRSWRNGPSVHDEILPYGPVQRVAFGETRLLRQRVQVEVAEERMLFAAAEPVAVDQPLVRTLRGPDDLIGLQGAARQYVVHSEVPQASAAGLRAASGAYPELIRSRYLTLREDTPTQLWGLAAEITAEAATAYDVALAIERYLRQFEYDLDVPAPPPGQDAVAYFLFDLQRGYCDYYASAFVVLARAVGLPARLAVGYATGEYDPQLGCYEVLQLHGHSWPEVYFAGYGWIPFEPTAAYRLFERPAGGSVAGETVPTVPAPPRRSPLQVARVWWQRVRESAAVYLLGAGAALLTAAAVAAGCRARWRRRLPPAEAVALCYGEMVRLGGRLGVQRRPSHTPREYAQVLVTAMRGRPARWPGPARTLTSALQETAAGVQALSEAYVRASYGAAPLTAAERVHAEAAWRALRRQMWWLWVVSARAGRKRRRELPLPRDPRHRF